MRLYLSLSIVALLTAGCAPTPNVEQDDISSDGEPSKLAEALMTASDGSSKGAVQLQEADGALTLEIALTGLEAGPKAFHLHTTGKCDAPDFKSAGGHLNPFGKVHGSLNADGKHFGDFDNIEVSDDGTYNASRSVDGELSDIQALLFDEDGTAVMIHAGADDYTTDPAGAAGPRIVCGVLKPAN